MHSLHVNLRAKGFDVHVLADERILGREPLVHDGVPIWPIPMVTLTSSPFRPGNLKIASALLRGIRIVKERIGKPDVILTTPFREVAIIADRLAATYNVPWVVRVASRGAIGDFTYMQSNWLTRMMTPWLAGRAAAVLVFDKAMQADAIANGVSPDRVHLVHNAVTVDGSVASSGARERIVFVGRVGEQKGVDTLIAAYAHARKSGGVVAPVDIVGGGEVERFQRFVADRDLQGKVFLQGHQWDVWPFLARASCYVSASNEEGFPNAVIEACAAGAPAILSDIPVHREIAQGAGTERFLFPVGDVNALANALTRFFALDAPARDDLRNRAVAYSTRFSREARDETYIELFLRLTASENRKGLDRTSDRQRDR